MRDRSAHPYLCFSIAIFFAACGDDAPAPPPDASADADASLTGDADAMDSGVSDADAGGGSPSVDWVTPIPIGSFSSPVHHRVDGRDLLLLGYGIEGTAGGALALDATTGEEVWRVEAGQEMFALARPLGAPEDNTFVFAGRNGWLFTVDVATGEKGWEFAPNGEAGRAEGYFNFYSGFAVEDVNDDGLEDFVVPNGGDNRALPGAGRMPGFLLVVSGADGSVLRKWNIPEGKETYVSLTRWPSSMGEDRLVFGSGGETISGDLWSVPLSALSDGSCCDALELAGLQRLLSGGAARGFIPPPSYADLGNDGTSQLFVAPFDGRLVALQSPEAMEPLWTFTPPAAHETNASPALADVDGDGDLDVFHIAQRGVYPMWSGSSLWVFDATTGTTLWETSTTERLVIASPLSVDLDGDGKDELLYAESDPGYFFGEAGSTLLQVAHVDEARVETVASVAGLTGGAGWVGDADADGRLEWFVPMAQLGGGALVRVDLAADAPETIAWGGYLGTDHGL